MQLYVRDKNAPHTAVLLYTIPPLMVARLHTYISSANGMLHHPHSPIKAHSKNGPRSQRSRLT